MIGPFCMTLLAATWLKKRPFCSTIPLDWCNRIREPPTAALTWPSSVPINSATAAKGSSEYFGRKVEIMFMRCSPNYLNTIKSRASFASSGPPASQTIQEKASLDPSVWHASTKLLGKARTTFPRKGCEVFRQYWLFRFRALGLGSQPSASTCTNIDRKEAV